MTAVVRRTAGPEQPYPASTGGRNSPVPAFQECFLGEGNYDPATVILALKRNGFTGFLLDDHVPHVDDDTDWCHRGRAHAIGYMQGLMNMMELVA